MEKIARGVLALGVSLICAVPAARGASGPLFQVPGVINVQSLGTYISCTNIGTVATDVTVQFFDHTGGAAGTAGPLTVNPQASALVGTRPASGFVVTVNSASPSILVGSAQISSTLKTIACSAFLADANSGPPTSMVALKVISKKQRGD